MPTPMGPCDITATLKVSGHASTVVIYNILSEVGIATANAKPMPRIEVAASERREFNHIVTITARGTAREVFSVQADILELLQEHDRFFRFLGGSITTARAIDDIELLERDETARELGLSRPSGVGEALSRLESMGRPRTPPPPPSPLTTGDDTRIEELNLRIQAKNCLRRAGIQTIGELLAKSSTEIEAIPNFGDTSKTELTQKLVDRGLGPLFGP